MYYLNEKTKYTFITAKFHLSQYLLFNIDRGKVYYITPMCIHKVLNAQLLEESELSPPQSRVDRHL